MFTAGAIVLASLALAGIGLYLSFGNVAVFAYRELHFHTLTDGRLFISGVDLGILILIAIDLVMAWLRRPIGWVRYPVWLLTGATVVFNAASAVPSGRPWELLDYVAVFAHAVVPTLFIVVVEVGRTAVDRVVRHDEDEEVRGIPLSRWLLAPPTTFKLWRKTKLWGVSATEVMDLERDLTVYKVMLERQHGSVRQAPSDARLPLKMAEYGLGIDDALRLPQEAKERDQRRKEAERDREAAEKTRAKEREAEIRRASLLADGSVEAAQHEVAGETGQAQARAEAAVRAARRSAQAEEEAAETASSAEAQARAAEAQRLALEERERVAEADRVAVEAERHALEARHRNAEIERLAREDEARAEAAQADAARARQEAAEADRVAVETRHRVAEIELKAVELEDAAKLSPRERTVRKIARTILHEHGGVADRLPLDAISTAFDVSTGTASAYRSEAVELLASGYRPGVAA